MTPDTMLCRVAELRALQVAETGLGLAFGDTPDGFQVLWVQLFADPR